MKISIVFISFIFSLFAWTQDYALDMGKVVTQLHETSNCALNSKINVFNNATDRVQIITMHSTMLKSGEDYRSKIDKNEVISNNKYLISIDYEEKTVEVNKAQKLSKGERKFLEEFQRLGQENNLKEAPELIENKGGVKTYLLNFKTGDILSAEVTLNTANNKLNKVVYYYSEKAFSENSYVEIIYTRFDLESAVLESELLGKDVVKIKGENCILTPKYSQYTLINNLKN